MNLSTDPQCVKVKGKYVPVEDAGAVRQGNAIRFPGDDLSLVATPGRLAYHSKGRPFAWFPEAMLVGNTRIEARNKPEYAVDGNTLKIVDLFPGVDFVLDWLFTGASHRFIFKTRPAGDVQILLKVLGGDVPDDFTSLAPAVQTIEANYIVKTIPYRWFLAQSYPCEVDPVIGVTGGWSGSLYFGISKSSKGSTNTAMANTLNLTAYPVAGNWSNSVATIGGTAIPGDATTIHRSHRVDLGAAQLYALNANLADGPFSVTANADAATASIAGQGAAAVTFGPYHNTLSFYTQSHSPTFSLTFDYAEAPPPSGILVPVFGTMNALGRRLMA